ncbi:MAG TPA: polysaccharide deacetylase family protein [Gemmatimonadaceae bacterium]|jgi:peptidoglycan/xylan/chitin deacetylase (PgdA/CDA1 family)|nr:polysaccharide deacetylase family protein [Gemmatimonadaceae bacterium]
MILSRGGRAVSLMYHDVVTNGDVASSGFDGPGADIYKLDRGEFAQHLAGIALAPSTVDASGTVRGGSPTGLPVFLTFDDGGVTAHSNAAPLLEERGWRGLFYITTDRIGTTGFVSASQLRDLLARGHVIGSHSCSHPKRISDCSRTELQHEWGDSVDALEQILGSPVTTASVPGGFYSRLVGSSAAAAGVKILFTSEPTTRVGEVDGCLLLGRYGVWRGMPVSTSADIARGRVLPRLRQSAYWSIKKAAKSLPGDPYGKLRGLLLDRRS